MDDERLDVALMFPSLDLLAGDITRADVAAANARAYNRWMADFVSEDPIAALRRWECVRCNRSTPRSTRSRSWPRSGLTGLTFRPERYAGLELYSPEMDRVWSAAEDHDLTVAIHGSFGSKMKSFAKTRYSQSSSTCTWYATRSSRWRR